ncbi:hypothetical protein [Parabacteroides sp. PF5-6]|uniref:hypothetical protein n=1 Tax=Parabacteroides sp. PF5-6 TaxID=1742403 RepID=UPI002404B278|nr:hypothetical protein [Parabacteroides sp. PF5-6]MDF9830027.1 hypothetical protein [Parabacteroides sp. PF5-6]
MNTNTAKVQSIIEATFVSAMEGLTGNGAGSLISDLYVQVEKETGELQIYDDSENVLNKIVIFDWVKRKDNDTDSFYKHVAVTLKAVLTVLSTKGLFENPCFIKPLSVSLTDDSFVVIEELLFIDDDLFRLDDPLLQDLDAELDDFLANLLSDVK